MRQIQNYDNYKYLCKNIIVYPFNPYFDCNFAFKTKRKGLRQVQNLRKVQKFETGTKIWDKYKSLRQVQKLRQVQIFVQKHLQNFEQKVQIL